MAGKYDWEPIEKAYRTGKYSNRQLSQIHGPSEVAIRKNALVEKTKRLTEESPL
jgi:hypothetical protein